MQILFASDHAGFDLKNTLMRRMEEVITLTEPTDSCTWHNLGPTTKEENVDYPDYAHAACCRMLGNPEYFAVLVCGTGIGMSIVANRYHHIRCAVATNVKMAEMARQHNNANVLALGARLLQDDTAIAILRTFLATPREVDERHDRRIAKFNPV